MNNKNKEEIVKNSNNINTQNGINMEGMLSGCIKSEENKKENFNKIIIILRISSY